MIFNELNNAINFPNFILFVNEFYLFDEFINKNIFFIINILKVFNIFFSTGIFIIIYKTIFKLKFFNSKGSNTKSNNFNANKNIISSNSSSLPNPNSKDKEKNKKKEESKNKDSSKKKLRKRDILKGIALGVIVGIIIYFFSKGGGSDGASGSDAISIINNNDNTTTTTISKALTIEKKVETVSAAAAVTTKVAHDVLNELGHGSSSTAAVVTKVANDVSDELANGSGSAEYVSELARSSGVPANTELVSAATNISSEVMTNKFTLPKINQYNVEMFKKYNDKEKYAIIYDFELERLNKIVKNISMFGLSDQETIKYLSKDLYKYKLFYFTTDPSIIGDIGEIVHKAYLDALKNIYSEVKYQSISNNGLRSFRFTVRKEFYSLLNHNLTANITAPFGSSEYKEAAKSILSNRLQHFVNLHYLHNKISYVYLENFCDTLAIKCKEIGGKNFCSEVFRDINIPTNKDN